AFIFSGAGKVQNASLKLPSLNETVQIHNSDMRFSQNSATLENVSATVGQTNASGSLTVKDFAAPQLTANLHVPGARISELLSIAKSATLSAVDGVSGDGTLPLYVLALHAALTTSAFIFSGTGKIQNASLKLPSLNETVQIHNSDMRFSQNSATLENVSA